MNKQLLLIVLIAFLLNLSSSAQVIISPTGDGGFETGTTFTANGWTVANDGGSGTRNEWFLGNPTGLGATGNRAAFISNNGTAYAYSNNRASVSHFYRDITIPANTSVNLSFSWKANGESCCDYIQVFVVPISTTPAGGTQLTSGQVGSELNLQNTWQSASFSGVVCNNTASAITRRLVFSWRNDGSDGTNPPGAIDNISVEAIPIPFCNLGTGVTSVASLPYSSGAGTTCGAVNDLTSSNTATCGSSSYLGGEDRVWIFTAPSSGIININLTSSGSWTGLMVYDGCPVTTCSTAPTGTCVVQSQSSSGDKAVCFNATSGFTYYVVLDVFPSPNCNPYTDLTISAPSTPSCSLGTGVTNVASLPYSSGAGTTCGAVNDLTSSNTATCGSSTYFGGEDRVWIFTPTTTGTVTIELTSTGSNTALMLYSACPSFGTACSIPSATCIAQTQSTTGNKTLCANVAAGTTYYLVLDSSTGCNAYTNLTISAPGGPVCTLGTGVTNVASLPYSSGAGTTAGAVNDITSANVTEVCGSSSYYTGEDRVWIFTPSTSGSITIDLASTGTYTGLMLYDGCPVGCGATGVCVANAQSSTGDKSLCVSVVAGRTYYLVLDSWDAPASNPYTNLSISAPVPSAASACSLAGTYTLSSIAHNPDVLTSSNLSGFTDDVFYPGGTIATGFDFCMNGNQYQNFLISANGYVIFAPPASSCTITNLPSGNAVAGGYSGWSITANIPNTTNAPRNAILSPWHDIDPRNLYGGSGVIRYQVFGTAPNRRFVVSWENVPMYSNTCGSDRSLDFTSQIKMFETTNDIEIHITRKRICSSWNDGRAILGLHNYNGTEALVPAGRNGLDASWTATNEAYRFTFNPATCTTCSPLPLNLIYFVGEW
jgi:hypothetical protein